MKYSLDAAHRAFFLEHGAITFEDLFKPEEAENCAAASDRLIHSVWKFSRFAGGEGSPDAPLAQGRDGWRLSPEYKKWVTDRRCAEIANQLVGARPLRLLTEQRCGGNPFTWIGPMPVLTPGVEKVTLENFLSFQGIACGLVLCLRAPTEAPPSFFGTKPGMGTYISAKTPLPLEQLLRGPEYHYMLIVYGMAVSLFIHQPRDPAMHALRELGYHYGDRLKDALHPIVFR